MRRITREEAKLIDRKAQDEFHISGLILMENAGLEVAKYSKKFLKNKLSKVLVFCGRGNNAGDGFVAARHLINNGYEKVKVIVIKEGRNLAKDAALNFKILSKNINRVNTLSASGYAKIGHQEDYIINKTTIRNYVNTIDANYYHGPDNHGQRTLINQQPKNPTLIDFTKLRLRKLTPLECERLQGFPDNWTMGLSDTQRYKTLGNAVTVNTVRYAKSLL